MSLDNIISGALGSAGTVAVGIAGYLAKRHTSKPQKAQEFETVVAGFNKLVGDLQQECTRLSNEVNNLHGVVTALTGHIGDLEDAMREHGVPFPARPRMKG